MNGRGDRQNYTEDELREIRWQREKKKLAQSTEGLKKPWKARLDGFFQAPFVWCWWWIRSRQLSPLLKGLPAAVVSMLALVVMVEASRTETARLTTRYQRAATAAFAKEDTTAALLWLEQAAALRPEDDKLNYELAIQLAADSQNLRARALMQQLAPLDSPGFTAAHFWLARELMLRPPITVTPEQRREIQTHLTAVISAQPESLAPRTMLANFHLRSGRRDLAIADLSPLAYRDLRASIQLMQLYSADEQQDALQQVGEFVVAESQRRLTTQPDSEEDQVRLVVALTLLNRDAEAVRMADASLRQQPTLPMRRLRSTLLIREYDRRVTGQSDEFDTASRLRMLQTALVLTPASAPAMERLIELSRLDQADESQRQAVEAELKKLLADGQTPAIIHMVLGIHAYEEGDVSAAELHMNQAVESNANVAGFLNNLAYVMLQSETPQLDRALAFANRAVELQPENAELRATRGEILIVLERWQDAIRDFELALRTFPGRADIHRGLAQAYRALGQTDLAELHEQRLPPANAADAADAATGLPSAAP